VGTDFKNPHLFSGNTKKKHCRFAAKNWQGNFAASPQVKKKNKKITNGRGRLGAGTFK
jgi:hypothetical protein